MMSPRECPSKAAGALLPAADATDQTQRAVYNAHAREWTALSMIAEVQCELEADLIERDDETDNETA